MNNLRINNENMSTVLSGGAERRADVASPRRGRFSWTPLSRTLPPGALLIFTLATAYGQSDPWSNAATRLATAFTGPIAKGFALVAIVVGGLQLAFSEGGGRRALGGLIFGLGLALGASQVVAWLFT